MPDYRKPISEGYALKLWLAAKRNRKLRRYAIPLRDLYIGPPVPPPQFSTCENLIDGMRAIRLIAGGYWNNL